MKVKGSVRSYRSKTEMVQDFPGGPVAKTLPSQWGGWGLIPGPGIKSHMPQLSIQMLIQNN